MGKWVPTFTQYNGDGEMGTDFSLNYAAGNHFFVNATIDGSPCMRAYTPTSLDDDVGFLEMVIKVYFRSPPPPPSLSDLSLPLPLSPSPSPSPLSLFPSRW